MRSIFFVVFSLVAPVVFASELLPVEAFANLPSVSQVRVSPNGKNVSFLRRIHAQGVRGTALSVYNRERGEVSMLLYADNKKCVISWARWANDEQLLVGAVYPSTRFGADTTETRMLKVGLDGKPPESAYSRSFLRKLHYFPQFFDQIVDWMPEDPNHILVELSGEDVYHSRVLQLDLQKGKVKTLQRSMKFVEGWETDRQHRVRIAYMREDTSHTILIKGTEDESRWTPLWEFESFSPDQVWPMGFDEDPNVLYVKKYHEGRLAVFKVDLSDNPKTNMELVFSDENYDVNGRLIYSATAKKVVGLTYFDDGGYIFWDERYSAIQRGINQAFPEKDNIILDFSGDEHEYIVLSTSDSDPGTYYLVDRKNQNLISLASRYQDLSNELMVEKNWVNYRARDGLEIEAALSLPKGEKQGPYPTVIHPHGGPISYDGDEFDYWTQFFVNRGYAVLQMNFRGLSGYGFDFMSAGLKGWGKQMQTDVEDGTRWLIEKGIADPERICMVGASYGGYAALMEAARNSSLYKCAVSFAGVTDLNLLLNSSYNFTNYDVVKEQIGDDRKDLKLNSPVRLAEQIDIPVLLVHGTKDRSVRVQHSRKMEKALKRAGKSVRYIEQKNGSHYLTNEAHRLQLFKEMDAFLAEYLN